MIGIYKITNKINNKCYIGQSVDIKQRWKSHKSSSRAIEDGGDTYTIHQAIRKYGIDNFNFEIIELTSQELLNSREQYWIQFYDSFYNGYNETLGGDGSIKYDYKKFLELWNSGCNCKEIEEIMCCGDQVITKALHSFDISEEEIRSRSNYFQRKPIVAIDIVSMMPLKVFNSVRDASLFFYNNLNAVRHIFSALKLSNCKRRAEGYYWEYLTDNNMPIKKLSDSEFLSYRQEKLFTLSEEQKKHLADINQKVERCDRETLKSLIRSTPFTRIAEQFGVTDNAIRKWCDYYNLPRRVKDIKSYSDEEWNNI